MLEDVIMDASYQNTISGLLRKRGEMLASMADLREQITLLSAPRPARLAILRSGGLYAPLSLPLTPYHALFPKLRQPGSISYLWRRCVSSRRRALLQREVAHSAQSPFFGTFERRLLRGPESIEEPR